MTEEEVPAFGTILGDAQAALGTATVLPELEFEEFEEGAASPDTELINGTEVDARFFPGVLRMRAPVSCTASLIGPATILLAAHCLSANPDIKVSFARAKFKVAGQNRLVAAICQAAPGYEPKNSHDWALCALQHAVRIDPAYESVNVSELPPLNKTIVLTGYGCTERPSDPPRPVAADPNRPLKAGLTQVVALPSAENAFITTKSDDGQEAVLCPGDSGGPAFVRLGNRISDSRMIVGVNAQTNFAAGRGSLSATGSQSGSSFIRDWSARNGMEVCGLNAGRTLPCMWSPE